MRDFVGVALYFVFSGAFLFRAVTNFNLFYLLVAVNCGLVAYFYVIRKPALAVGSWYEQIIAMVSTFLPLLYVQTHASTLGGYLYLASSIVMVSGVALSTIGVIELGDCFGMSPAFRGKTRTSGIFRFVKHPIYLGYIVSQATFIFIHPVNILLFGISAALYFVRSKLEERYLVY